MYIMSISIFVIIFVINPPLQKTAEIAMFFLKRPIYVFFVHIRNAFYKKNMYAVLKQIYFLYEQNTKHQAVPLKNAI